MKRLCVVIGAVVMALILANSGLITGDVCAGQIGCVNADQHGWLIHKRTP